MDRIRFGLWFGLLAAVWISYTTWVEDNRPATTPVIGVEQPTPTADELPAAIDGGDLPGIGTGQSNVPELTAADEPATPGRLISVQTDVLDLRINLDV